ncbi:MAG: thioesterase [Tatlockia sp.]|nr:thioesterase [Tatlockia sp.]
MTNTWLQLRQTSQLAKFNLLCFPFAGGYAESFLPWRKYLPPDFQLCPIQLPGRSYRWQEPVYTDIQLLLNAMLPSLLPLLQEQPYLIFGHSMGGYIAYEFSKALVSRGLPLPKLLVVSSVAAPMHWFSHKALSKLTQKEFSDFFLDLGGFHPELLKDAKFINNQITLLREDIRICESCVYAEPAQFPFPILGLGGREDDYIRITSMADWQQETRVDFNLQEFSGKHFYMNEHLPAILKLIKEKLNTKNEEALTC